MFEGRDPSNENVCEANRAFILESGPVRPAIDFPPSPIGGRNFKFQKKWYEEYSWLEYSVAKDAAFCFSCRCFGQLVGSSDDAFTKTGFRNWKNATGEKGKLSKHANSRMHTLSTERIHSFKSATPIDVQLNREAEAVRERKEQERKENREIVETIFDVVRHLAKQNMSFRGHDESYDSKNKGNFLEELQFLSKYHAPLRKWMDTHPENVSYFSHVSQNEMISILSNLITEVVCNEVRSAKYFSIQCDEVTSHKKAFMSVILRYVTDFKITERCIRLVRVSSLKGRSLAEVIVDIMKDLRLSLIDLIGKGFDGAANMSGKDEGVQRHLTEAGADFQSIFIALPISLILFLNKVWKRFL
ncbi:zinc finger MYM-type protein 1-like [Dendronephthya gigantea]|uniref:zinc finger MYM-type protein 1-like n=1 Tax=Dendronephthya gigantea TaxID=151771 RepID=UPI00106C3FF7|nr:zinc finger MYM-type protein 1-like [Dendronephthya gigantea]